MMQPNLPSQYQQPQQSASAPVAPASVDYLNQIAAPIAPKTVNPMILWGSIGGFLLLLCLIIFFMLNSGGPSYSERLTAFAQRVNALRSLTKDSATKIQTSKLRSINSSLSLALTNTLHDSETPLANVGVKQLPSPVKTSKLAKEFDGVASRLEDARLNNTFDRIYVREVTYEIAQVQVEIKQLRSLSKSISLTKMLDSTNNNLTPLAEQFETFNNSQG